MFAAFSIIAFILVGMLIGAALGLIGGLYVLIFELKKHWYPKKQRKRLIFLSVVIMIKKIIMFTVWSIPVSASLLTLYLIFIMIIFLADHPQFIDSTINLFKYATEASKNATY